MISRNYWRFYETLLKDYLGLRFITLKKSRQSIKSFEYIQAEVDGTNGRVLDRFFVTTVGPKPSASAPASPPCHHILPYLDVWVVHLAGWWGQSD